MKRKKENTKDIKEYKKIQRIVERSFRNIDKFILKDLKSSAKLSLN